MRARDATPMRWLSRYKLHLAAALLAVGVMETSAFLVFTLILADRPVLRQDLDAFAAPPRPEEVDTFRRWGWDPTVGWLHRPGVSATREASDGRTWRYTIDARGARANPYDGPGGFVSAYGDSFTFGDEVDDDETWPYALSELTGTAVDNWGQSGWGPDQALLRLRGNLPARRTTAVVLAIMTENLARLVNSYRPFLTRNPHMRFAFKPMLAWHDGALVWLPSPLHRLDVPADFVRAFARATTTDYWYAQNARRVRPHFPYLAFLPSALWCTIRACHRPDLWAEPQVTARLDRIIEEFQALARTHDFAPIVLFIPEPREMRRFTRGRRLRYRGYVERLRRRADLDGLRIVDVLDRDFDAARFNLRPFKGHPSPYGHRVIADAVQAVLPPRRADGHTPTREAD
jgi:lysophospholipase L1-like esterase